MEDAAIPVVFPAYLIAVPRPGVDLPAFMNKIGLKDIPPKTERVPDLGHAGVLFFRGKDGLSKYYEYGRYDAANLGIVRNRSVPDLLNQKGMKLAESLTPVLASISKEAGQGGLVKGVLIPAPGQFKAMLAYAEKRRADNNNPARKSYSLFNNSCIDFAREVVLAAGVDLPNNFDPRPVAYIEKLKPLYQNVMYDPRTKKVTLT